MGTTRLKLYNAALQLCGAAAISSLTEEVKSRRILDDAWDNDFVRKALEKGYWKFALRSVQLDFDPSYTPSFGYIHAFAKASDWVHTAALCNDEYYNSPLLNYSEEAGFIYTDEPVIYVQYVSDDAAFGGDLSTWTASFQEYAEVLLASKIVHALTNDKERVAYIFGGDGRGVRHGMLAGALKTARSKDAIQGPPKFLPMGSWTRARTRGGSRGDNGPNGQLIG